MHCICIDIMHDGFMVQDKIYPEAKKKEQSEKKSICQITNFIFTDFSHLKRTVPI